METQSDVHSTTKNRRNRKTDTYSDKLESYYSEYIKICTRYGSVDDIKKWYIEKFGELS